MEKNENIHKMPNENCLHTQNMEAWTVCIPFTLNYLKQY